MQPGEVGGVGDATGVVEVEVGEHDVANIFGRKTEGSHPAACRRDGVVGGARDELEHPGKAVGGVVRADARFHQHQAIGRFDEQAVADQVPAFEEAAFPVRKAAGGRTQGAAVEVVHAHDGPGGGGFFELGERPIRYDSAAHSELVLFLENTTPVPALRNGGARERPVECGLES